MPIQANGYWPLAVILSYIHPKRNTIFSLPTTIFIKPNFHFKNCSKTERLVVHQEHFWL
jgi:hypothetical protein